MRSGHWPSTAQAARVDGDFLVEFRSAGLRWTQYACLAVGALLLLFLTLPQLSNRYTPSAVQIRLGMLAVVASMAYILHRYSDFAVRHYALLVGSACSVTLGGVAVLVAMHDVGAVAAGFSPVPAVLVGLFIGYGFLRLPLKVIASICWGFSLLTVLLAPGGFSGDGQIRLFLYVLTMNVLGMVLCHSIETRERELFVHRRRAEAAQAELKERAVAAEEAHMEKTRLLAAVNHDLRQPMMATTAYLAVLGNKLKQRDLEQAGKQLAHLQGAVGLLETSLDHLLTAARYDSGTEPMRIEMVELEPLLQQIAETFGPDAHRRGIELRVRAPAVRLLVKTDATALWRVLMNLVSNAVKFTESRGRKGRGVTVRAALVGDGCRIDIADTGIGIPQEYLDSIWQPYFQVGNAERDRSRGLGLGLFLVRRALDHLPGHRLALRSRPGRGSRFSVFLPGARLREARVAKPVRPKLDPIALDVLRGAYVLVLEDDHDARRAILALLDDWGVLHASGATLEELLDDAGTSTRSADALISDYRLPGGRTGAECIESVRSALDECVPAVIITAESDLAAIRDGMPFETQILQKPFDPNDLAAFLYAAILRARRLEQDETGLARREI